MQLLKAEPSSIFEQAAKHDLIPHVAYASESGDEIHATVLYKGCVIMFAGPLNAIECCHAFHASKQPVRTTAIELCAAFVRLHYK